MHDFKWTFLLLFATYFGCEPSTTMEEPSSQPNIIILLADDLGYRDLGCFSGQAHTPNLDLLANNGIRFTDFYAAASNCSPSRVGLLTGMDPAKLGMYNYMPGGHPMHLRAEAVTMAEIAKQGGYQTGHFGKWHVSNLADYPNMDQPSPADQGFDYSLGTTNNAQPSHLNPNNFVRNGQLMGEMEGYSCDIVVQEAINWINEINAKESSFFTFIAFHEPHKKVASPPDLVAKYDTFPKADAEYLANIENMDQAIGQLLTFLEDQGIFQNTMILFASDNGSYRNGSNGELLGGKSFVYEGGIRVPGIIHWPAKIKKESVSSTPIGLIDLMPTVCAITGIDHPSAHQLDGINILPLLKGQAIQRTKPLSWFFYRTSPEIAMRFGDYVMLGRDSDSTRHTHPTSQPDMDYIKSMTIEDFELYHLPSDISQSNHLDYQTLDLGQSYKTQITERLQDIQETGPYWENLPPANTNKKLKSEWRRLRPKGFSN